MWKPKPHTVFEQGLRIAKPREADLLLQSEVKAKSNRFLTSGCRSRCYTPNSNKATPSEEIAIQYAKVLSLRGISRIFTYVFV